MPFRAIFAKSSTENFAENYHIRYVLVKYGWIVRNLANC